MAALPTGSGVGKMQFAAAPAQEWALVADKNMGFNQTSSLGHTGSSFSSTTLLEKEKERLEVERANLASKLDGKSSSRAPRLSGRALCIAAQYSTEASSAFIQHKQLRYSKVPVVHGVQGKGTDKMPRGINHGNTTSWIDVSEAKGCLQPIVASSRPGVTRMLC